MEKRQEIQMLGELIASDTNFHEEFDTLDVQQMQRNIASDYPLLLHTGYIKLTSREIRLIRHLLTQETLILQNKNSPIVVCGEQRILNDGLLQFIQELNNKLETEG